MPDMKMKLFNRLFCLAALVGVLNPQDGVAASAGSDSLSFVDPLIGTEGTGSQYGGMMPMIGVPFGSIHWVPMTRLTEVGTLSYNQVDDKLLGFVGSRQPAIWMGEWGQISFQPRTGAVDCDFATRGIPFSHADEKLTPWKAMVKAGETATEMAGRAHASIYRIRFTGTTPHLVIDASRDYRKGHSDLRPADGSIEIGSDGRTVSGWNSDRLDAHHSYDLPNFKGWFVMEFSRPFTTFGTYVGDPQSVKNPQKGLGAPNVTDYQKVVLTAGNRSVTGNRCGGWVGFAESSEPLLVKIGVSLISREQAWENLKREIPDWDLDAVVTTTKAEWAEKFSRLSIETPAADVKTIFYTGLYHALLYPREIGEYGRYYSAFDDKIHNGTSYTCYSLWDTYRAEHPLLTLVAPERVDGMMNGLLQAYREGGWLPKWPNPGYTGIMAGAPAEMVLAEAWSKGFRGFDVKEAYAAVKKNATVPQPTDKQFDWRDRGCFGATPETRGGLSWYQELGYVACDKVKESVSRTQDFCLNDTAAAILADAAGASADAAFFRARSKNYTNLWHAASQRFLPRTAAGAWADPLKGHHYCECSPETGLWCIPHDVEGLVSLLGGAATFEKELDTYFETLFWKPERGNKSIHGNEPSHHTSYLYNFIGKPEKSAFRIREIMTRSYSTNRKGFDGNEDCGQMSAWYILSALGFYPMNTATGWYEIGSPIVDRAVVKIGGATLEVVCRNQAPENYAVKAVTFNGKPLANHRIHHNELAKGGRLEFVMGRPGVKTLFDIDFGAAKHRVDTDGKGSFHGVLPDKVGENFAGWSTGRATSEVRDDAGRKFLRIVTKPGDMGGQFAINGFKLDLPGYFRLKVRARTSGSRPLTLGLRQNGAPYTGLSSHTFLSSDWKEECFLFAVKKSCTGSIGLYFYTSDGVTDIARISLETASEADLAAQIPRPSKDVAQYLRHTRFPLGLPCGWNLGRETARAQCTADTVEPAADGLPVLKVVSDEPWELYSEPFQTAFPGEPHQLSFKYRSTETVSMLVSDNDGHWVLERTLPPVADWSEQTFTIKPRLLSTSTGVRFSGSKGSFRLDAISVRPPNASASMAGEVALAVGDGEIAADTRIQFVDEPARVRWTAWGTTGTLKAKISDLYGREKMLPDVLLTGTVRGTGVFSYDVFPERPVGQFRIFAWVERAGVRVTPVEELVVTRLPRPVAWGRDASDSPFGGHFNPVPGVVKAMKAGGLNWVRLHDAGEKVSNWYKQEPVKGQWDVHDADVAQYRSNGIKIFAQLGTSPAWASHYGDLGCKHMGYFEKYLRPTNQVDWVNYVTTYVKHHEANIDEYFIWNEPWGRWWDSAADIKYFDKTQAGKDFADLSRLAYEAVKKVNPKIRVSGFNSTAGDTGRKWTESVLAGGAFDCCDVIDWHYYTPHPRGLREDANITATPLAPIRAAHPDLGGKPVYMSEGQGTSSGASGVGCRMSGLLQEVPWKAESVELYTGIANATCRYVLSLLAEGNTKIFLYSSHSYTALARMPSFLVLLGADGFAHPALVAHAQMARAIEGKRFVRKENVGSDGVVYVFANADETVRAYSELSKDEVLGLLANGPVVDVYGNPVSRETYLPGTLVYMTEKIRK